MISRKMVLGESKKESLRLASIMAVSNILLRVISIPFGIITTYILGPTLLGLFKIYNLIITYVSFSSLGLFQTMLRQVPIAMGKKDESESNLIQDLVFSANVIIMVLTIAVLWILFLSDINFKNVLNYFRLSVLTITLVFNQINNYLHNYIKAIGEFTLMTKRTVILDWMSSILFVVLVLLWKLDGALVAVMISSILGMYLYLKGVQIRIPRWKLHLKKLKEFYFIGFKVFINKMADSIFWTIDTTIIAVLLLPRELGLYVFALGVVASSISLSGIFTMMMYRHMLNKRGELGLNEGRGFLKEYLENPMAGYITLNTIFIVLAYFLCIFVVNLFLHQFTASLNCLTILALGQIFFVAATVPSICMNVSDQLDKRFVITVVGLGLNAVLDIIFIKSGYGIVGVAWASTISFFAFGTFIIFLVRRQVYGNLKDPVLFLIKFLSITFLTIFLMYLLQDRQLVSSSQYLSVWLQIIFSLLDAALKIIIVSGFVLAGYFITFRKQGLLLDCRMAVTYLLTEFKNRFSLLRYSR